MWLLWHFSAFPQMQEEIKSGLFSKALAFPKTTVCFPLTLMLSVKPPMHFYRGHFLKNISKQMNPFLKIKL